MHLLKSEEEFKNSKPSDQIELICEYCNKIFTRNKTKVMMVKKYEKFRPDYGKMNFCSQACSSKTPKKEIIKLLESNGLKIIPQDDYIGKDPIIYYHCPTCTHKTSKRRRSFAYKLFDCEECQDDKVKAKRKDRFYTARKFLKDNGYNILTSESNFVNSGTKTKYSIKATCPKGHDSGKDLMELLRGILRPCKVCMLKEKNGPKCNLYVDGRNKTNKDERTKIGSLLKTWRKDILNKFNKKCNICSSSEKLHAHHLNGFLLDEANRLNIENGVCLCQKCHIKFHTDFGKKNNIKAEYEQFYKNETTPLILDWSDWIP